MSVKSESAQQVIGPQGRRPHLKVLANNAVPSHGQGEAKDAALQSPEQALSAKSESA